MSAAGDDPRDYSSVQASLDDYEQRLIDLRRTGATRPVMIADWLKHDTWTRDEGLQLLLGLCPGSFRRASLFRGGTEIDGVVKTDRIISARYLDSSLVCWMGYRNVLAWLASEVELPVEDMPITSIQLVHLGVALRHREDLWDSGQHPARCAPAFFIEWAQSKDLEVPWLEWAMEEGLLAGAAGARPGEQAASLVDRATRQGRTETGPGQGSSVHRSGGRRQGDIFTVLIEAGRKAAQDPLNRASVWAAMVAIAGQPNAPAPFLGVDEEGIKIADDRAEGGIRHFTSEHLRDRWRKRKG